MLLDEPAGQAEHSKHPSSSQNFPFSHEVHDGDPSVGAYEPAIHWEQLEEPMLLDEPPGQAEHCSAPSMYIALPVEL